MWWIAQSILSISMKINDLRIQILIDRLSTSSDEALCRNLFYIQINLKIYTRSTRRIILILSVLSASSKTNKINRLQNRHDTYKHYTTHYIQTHLSIILMPLRNYSFRYTKNIISTFTLLNSRFQSYYNISLFIHIAHTRLWCNKEVLHLNK